METPFTSWKARVEKDPAQEEHCCCFEEKGHMEEKSVAAQALIGEET